MSATNQERFMLDEAERHTAELIAAAREVIQAWDAFDLNQAAADRLSDAIDRLEELVGRP